jgi:hypothetical protein
VFIRLNQCRPAVIGFANPNLGLFNMDLPSTSNRQLRNNPGLDHASTWMGAVDATLSRPRQNQPSANVFPNVGPSPQSQAIVWSCEKHNQHQPSFVTATGPVREARFPFL